jgi:hydroxymethylglutaryl-CoA lyase
VLSAGEAHNQAYVRRSTEDSLLDFERIAAVREQRPGMRGSPRLRLLHSGAVSEARVVEIAIRLAKIGADEIIVADTVGYGDPGQVRRLGAVVAAVRPLPFGGWLGN